MLELALVALAAAVNSLFAFRVTRNSRHGAFLLALLTLVTTVSLSTTAAAGIRLFEWMPGVQWFRALGLAWFLLSPVVLVTVLIWRRSAGAAPGRRLFLRAATSLAVAPAAALAHGFSVAKREPVVREIDIPCPNLPKDLHGLRIVQLSDVHLSPFVSRGQLRQAVSQANETRADLAVVTGDLITSYGDPLEEAFAELKRLRATAGVYGCHGNHEILAGAENYATRLGARQGLRFLRGENASLRFGAAHLNLAGFDYQKKGRPYLAGAARRCS